MGTWRQPPLTLTAPGRYRGRGLFMAPPTAALVRGRWRILPQGGAEPAVHLNGAQSACVLGPECSALLWVSDATCTAFPVPSLYFAPLPSL